MSRYFLNVVLPWVIIPMIIWGNNPRSSDRLNATRTLAYSLTFSTTPQYDSTTFNLPSLFKIKTLKRMHTVKHCKKSDGSVTTPRSVVGSIKEVKEISHHLTLHFKSPYLRHMMWFPLILSGLSEEG